MKYLWFTVASAATLALWEMAARMDQYINIWCHYRTPSP